MRAPINKRLLALSELIRDGAVLADVGTDHAYLAIYLLEDGRIERAVLSDINEGPLKKARENVAAFGLSDRVIFRLCDGARELAEYGITDYAIAGMGGELIAGIISAAPQLKDENVNLALQPMSKPEVLRSYLYNSGFDITDERYVSDEGKNYVCIRASFVGRKIEYSLADAHFGKDVFFEGEHDPAMISYMLQKQSRLEDALRGKRLGGVSTDTEEQLIASLRARLDLR